MIYNEKPWLKSYDPGVKEEISINENSIVDRFNKINKDFLNSPAAHFLGNTYNFEELMELADSFARCLADHNLTTGDVVAINLPNTIQYLIAIVGTIKAGCIVSGLSPLLSNDEIIFQLNDCKAKAIVTLDAIFEKKIFQISDKLQYLKFVITTNIVDFLPWYKRAIAKLLRKVPTGKVKSLSNKKVMTLKDLLISYPSSAPDIKIDQNTPAFLQYTGGTTGFPKGAVLTHGNVLANCFQLEEWVKMRWGEELILSGYPMFHAAGLTVALMGICFGCAQILIPDPRNVKYIINEYKTYKPTFIANVPTLYLMLLKETKFQKLDFSSLRVCVSAAAPFPVEGIKKFEEVIGKGKLIELYGMTETGPIQTMNPYMGLKKIGSVGLPFPSTNIKIVDLIDSKKELPIGDEGEILVSGPQVMKGYHNKEEETNKVLTYEDGQKWMHTGDIGKMDEDGYVYLVDRAKDMIIVGGFKVFSREVEDILYKHPAIEVCAIIGEPDINRPETETVKLYIQKSESCKDRIDSELKDDITAFAREKLSSYKVPKIIEFIDKIPLTSVGKVDKKALRLKK